MTTIITRIFYRDRFRNIKLDKSPKDTRELISFLSYNNAPLCFVKGVGGWYKISKNNSFLFVCRTLYLMSFQEWLKVAKDDNFTANIK